MYLQVLGIGLILLTLAMLYIVFTDKALRIEKGPDKKARLVVDPPWMRVLSLICFAIGLFLALGAPYLGLRGLLGFAAVLVPSSVGALCYGLAKFGLK